LNVQTEIKVTPPNISKETLKEMAQFFAKTSIPRILEEQKQRRNEQ
jgi:hypothetical protein